MFTKLTNEMCSHCIECTQNYGKGGGRYMTLASPLACLGIGAQPLVRGPVLGRTETDQDILLFVFAE